MLYISPSLKIFQLYMFEEPWKSLSTTNPVIVTSIVFVLLVYKDGQKELIWLTVNVGQFVLNLRREECSVQWDAKGQCRRGAGGAPGPQRTPSLSWIQSSIDVKTCSYSISEQMNTPFVNMFSLFSLFFSLGKLKKGYNFVVRMPSADLHFANFSI